MRYILSIIISILPAYTYAAITDVQDLLTALLDLFNNLIYVVFSFSLVIFFWGLAKFILNAGDEKTHEDGRHLMFWGIIALFVMTSIWGIIAFLQNNLGFDEFG